MASRGSSEVATEMLTKYPPAKRLPPTLPPGIKFAKFPPVSKIAEEASKNVVVLKKLPPCKVQF